MAFYLLTINKPNNSLISAKKKITLIPQHYYKYNFLST